MGRLSSGWLTCGIVIVAICGLGACGGHKPAGPSPFPAKITLTPATSASVEQGTIFAFSATAQNSSSGAVSPTFTFQSSNTDVLNIASNGLACAGRWDATFTTCTPLGSGAVQVTASALGATSAATVVFVHPPIDNITLTEAPSQTPPATPEPCVPLGRSITLQATAWSHNSDITATVGPFFWSANNGNVVKVTPILNSAFNVATNQAIAAATTPGLTEIYATASGVSSSPFVQAAPNDALNFFETCPVQSITLELGASGSQHSGQTTFEAVKGASESVTATVVDVLGNTLENVPLTWSASAPASVSSATGCTGQVCVIGTPLPGAGTVTASCTPPTCNIGFPQAPTGLAAPFIPLPVYAATAISGTVSGTTAATSVLAASLDCATTNLCASFIYNISTATNLAAAPSAPPAPINSLLVDSAGLKAYLGGNYGSFLVTVANLGSANSAFTSLGAAIGKVLAVSPNGNFAVISDTVHSPNQVFIVNTTASGAPTTTALNISGATAAGFSRDGLKAFILSGGNTIYVYSTLQALQNLTNLPAGTGSANLITFSPNGAFAFIAGTSAGTPALTPVNVCNNQIATHTDPNTSVTTNQIIGLDAAPLFLTTIPNVHLEGIDPSGLPFPDGVHIFTLDQTGIDVVTVSSTAKVATLTNPPTAAASCPQDLTHSTPNPAINLPQRIELGQGTLQPIAFFVSPDATQAFIVSSNLSSILVYSFNTGAVSAIPLATDSTTGQAVTPVSASMTTDGTLIYVAGSDGALHQVSTNPAVDLKQITFPNLPNLLNPFCTTGDCKLNVVAVKP
jgi:hypothetical protein